MYMLYIFIGCSGVEITIIGLYQKQRKGAILPYVFCYFELTLLPSWNTTLWLNRNQFILEYGRLINTVFCRSLWCSSKLCAGFDVFLLSSFSCLSGVVHILYIAPLNWPRRQASCHWATRCPQTTRTCTAQQLQTTRKRQPSCPCYSSMHIWNEA